MKPIVGFPPFPSYYQVTTMRVNNPIKIKWSPCLFLPPETLSWSAREGFSQWGGWAAFLVLAWRQGPSPGTSHTGDALHEPTFICDLPRPELSRLLVRPAHTKDSLGLTNCLMQFFFFFFLSDQVLRCTSPLLCLHRMPFCIFPYERRGWQRGHAINESHRTRPVAPSDGQSHTSCSCRRVNLWPLIVTPG